MNEYGICDLCKQRMEPGVSCTVATLTIGGKLYHRLPYVNTERPEQHNCHDCNTPLIGLHHQGCDMERCPVCNDGQQFITCFEHKSED